MGITGGLHGILYLGTIGLLCNYGTSTAFVFSISNLIQRLIISGLMDYQNFCLIKAKSSQSSAHHKAQVKKRIKTGAEFLLPAKRNLQLQKQFSKTVE